MNNIKQYFDKQAANWDKNEHITKQRLEQLVDLLPISNDMEICDLGCGTGIISGILASKTTKKVIGIDISTNMIEIAKSKYENNPNIEFINEDFYNNKLKFDFIVIYNAYPHFLDKEKLNKVLYESLNKGGYFAILHSLSRARLTQIHGKCEDISSTLLPVNKEAEYYSNDFNLIKSNENDSSYLLIFQKKD